MNPFKGLPQKSLLWLGAVVVLAVALIMWGKESTDVMNPSFQLSTANSEVTKDETPVHTLAALEKELEDKLTRSLSKISGVGQVQVLVTLSTGIQADYAHNESITERKSKESDNSGGTRETTEITENNQLVTPNGASQPVIVKEQRPEVAGVLVIAEGAKNAKVKESIHSAVRTLLDIPANKVAVETMGGQ